MSGSSPGVTLGVDERQLAELLAELRPKLQVILARARIPLADGEDLLQEVCLGLVRNWQHLDCPRAWLLVALSRSCQYYWIRRQRRPSLQALEETAEEGLATVPPEVDERRWDLATLLARLSPDLRQALRLRYDWGLSAVEIAVRLGHHPGSVRKRLCRARAQLRRAAGASSILTP